MPVRLNQLLKIQSFNDNYDEMHSYIFKCLKEIPNLTYEQDRVGNIYATKGTLDKFPAFICHTDTSAKVIEDFNILRLSKNFWMAYTPKEDLTIQHAPIGGAKAGIFISLKLLTELPNVKVAFYVNGQTGQTGARNSSISFFDDCRWVIQCDREGSGDIINRAYGIDLGTTEFFTTLESLGKKFKFRLNYGRNSDIAVLKDHLKLPVSSANLSAGFWAPGTPLEHIVEEHVLNTIYFCKEITRTVDKSYPHIYRTAYEQRMNNGAGLTRCKTATCTSYLMIPDDQICPQCVTMLQRKQLVCKWCKAAKLYTGRQFYAQTCYDCNQVRKQY